MIINNYLRNIQKIFNVNKCQFSSQFDNLVNSYDETQRKTFKDQLIKVDKFDNNIGPIDKLQAHQNSYILTTNGYPHRAFSVFIFNQQQQLLMHQRSNIKITYSQFWTNSCCSHPLHNQIECNEQNDIGIRIAAINRVKFELNLTIKDPLSLLLVDKIIYKSTFCEHFGEYEVDYVFFVTLDVNQSISFNKDEISNIKWIDVQSIQNFCLELKSNNQQITPWFQGILNYKLKDWWKLYNQRILKPYQKQNNIFQLDNSLN